MTDDERPDDLPGEEPAPLSDADEQWVVAQLRSLPPVEMPRDVQVRLEAALAAEASAAPAREGTAPDWTHGDNVVPMRRRAPFGAALMRAAAGLLLVVGGVVAVGYVGTQLSGSSNDSGDSAETTGSRSSAEDSSASAPVPVYTSGTAYTEDAIAAQASALTTSAGTPIDEITLAAAPTAPESASASSSESASAAASGSGDSTTDSEFLGEGERSLGEWLARIREAATTSALPLCIRSLLSPGDTVLAVDAASFDQEPAYIVVGRGTDSQMWYFAVRPTCLDPDTTDAVVLQFGNVDAG